MNVIKVISVQSFFFFCAISTIVADDSDLRAENPSERGVRILISDFTKVKKDYILTQNELVKHKSRKSDFGKIKWTLPEIVKKAEKHINEKLMAEVSPSIKWPPEGYNDEHEYPVGATLLNFSNMEFVAYRDYLYIVMTFHFRGPVGELLVLNVVSYLDGEIARIGDHDPQTARVLPPLKGK